MSEINKTTIDEQSTVVTKPQISQQTKKKYICESAGSLSKEDLLDLGKTIIRYKCGDKIKSSADGSRINLDTIPSEYADELINSLYSQVHHKISKKE